MTLPILDFERPLGELEAKIDELSRLSREGADGAGALDAEILALRERLAAKRAEAYANLDPWQKTQIARHPARPHFVDYLAALFTEFVELRGDRAFGDDQAIVAGMGRFRGQPLMIIGQEKGRDVATRLKHNFGAPRPEGYRKAIRLMDLAERFGLPVVTFIDTGGAYPGIDSEERGIAEAIARAIERCVTLGVPLVAVITGEGMSGGAIGIAAANKVLMLEHAIYAVISPEGCASILMRDRAMAEGAARAMKVTAQDLLPLRIVDQIIPEPVGGAHADPAGAIARVGEALAAALDGLVPLAPDSLREQRAQRFYAIGQR